MLVSNGVGKYLVCLKMFVPNEGKMVFGVCVLSQMLYVGEFGVSWRMMDFDRECWCFL